MHAFGVVSGLTKQLRISRLENRLNPAVPFPHKHDFYHLVFITSGSGWHEIDFRRHEVRAGRVFIMKSAQVHSWTMARQTKGYVIEFIDETLATPDPAFRRLKKLMPRSPDVCDVARPDWLKATALCDLMMSEYEAQAQGFEVAITSLLAALLTILARAPEMMPAVDVEQGLVAKFKTLIEAHFRSQHAVEFYAERLGLGAKALTMRIARATGRSARALIQERCLLESKRLLAYSDLTISTIAAELGFEDPGYFARFFRKKATVSPGSFRATARSLSQ